MSFNDQAQKVKQRIRKWKDGALISNNQQIDKLPRFLDVCNYSKDTKNDIKKSIREILFVFPDFNVQILQFYSNRERVRLLQMRRLLNFPSQPSIQVFLMYPPNFPRAPPYFRVVNPNPNQFHPKYAYIKLQSLNDPKSVILNSILNEIKSWNPSKSVNIIIEVNNLLRANYPFVIPFWGESKIYNIPYNQIIEKAIAFNRQQQEKLVSFNNKFKYTLNTIQKLDLVKYSLESQVKYLEGQNYKMSQIINQSNENVDLQSIIKPSDSKSALILQYFSSIKARGNVAIFLDQKFASSEITLEVYLKLFKKNQESKFQEKYLLQKLINKDQIQYSL